MKILKYFIKDFLEFISFIRTYRFNKSMVVGFTILMKRRKICNECPHIKKSKFFKTKRCGICGCFLSLKTKLRFEECPDEPSRWGMKL